ncbi:hypothetical protein [Bacillus sp. SRB3LM]|uniref:hypothetical protein n=1 Tax=Bacillus sp. SRB3LM TaxID=2608689 RepID=UPI001E3ED870|nr:hypothetical protein [Bacillus sp. SRB3LM]
MLLDSVRERIHARGIWIPYREVKMYFARKGANGIGNKKMSLKAYGIFIILTYI